MSLLVEVTCVYVAEAWENTAYTTNWVRNKRAKSLTRWSIYFNHEWLTRQIGRQARATCNISCKLHELVQACTNTHTLTYPPIHQHTHYVSISISTSILSIISIILYIYIAVQIVPIVFYWYRLRSYYSHCLLYTGQDNQLGHRIGGFFQNFFQNKNCKNRNFTVFYCKT